MGYVKWNRAWYIWLEEPNVTIPESFPEMMIEFYNRWEDGKAKIDIYKKIYKIGTIQKWASYFYLQNDLKQITYDMVKSIEKYESKIDKIQGAQELAVFDSGILDYIDKEPINVEIHDDGGCEFYFLNFNSEITEENLKDLISDGFWNKEKEFELKDIFILKQCYD